MRAQLQIVVTAYQRQPLLDRLLDELGGWPTLVVDDGSQPPLQAPAAAIYRSPHNLGRNGYWQTVTNGLRAVRGVADYYLFLADDLAATENAVARSLQMAVDASDACWAINLMRYPYISNWGHNGWVDGCFICPAATLDRLGWRVDEVSKRWLADPLRGSGVWHQVTRRIHGMGGQIHTVRRSVFLRGDNPSLMNPEAAKYRAIG